ncbi:MAG: diacylglycerol kinase family protein [Negativicutes bacterium]|jgi:YegS/Rv2252/BmrU family lipid kinase
MKHLFIINPAAGNGKGYKFVPMIKELAKEHRAEKDCEIELTQYPGHATEIARKYAAIPGWRVYAVGGDGTVNEVLNGMINSNNQMAVIPAGSGNDFVRSIGEKESAKKYFMNVIMGSPQIVDAGIVNGRYFLNVASLGIDAEACRRAQKYKKHPILGGRTAYLVGAAIALKNYATNDIEIAIDGETINEKITLMIIANAKYYGGGIPAAPNADMADGLLDVAIMPARTLYELAKIAPYFYMGKQNRIDRLIQRQTKKVIVNSENLLTAEFDGEVCVDRKFTFEIASNAINLVFPRSQHHQQPILMAQDVEGNTDL